MNELVELLVDVASRMKVMVVPRGTPYNRTRLDPNSLNKPAKDSSSKAQAYYYTPYQKEYDRYDRFPLLSTRLDPDSLNKPAKDSPGKAQAYYTPYQKGYDRFPVSPDKISPLSPYNRPGLDTGDSDVSLHKLASPHLQASANRVADTSLRIRQSSLQADQRIRTDYSSKLRRIDNRVHHPAVSSKHQEMLTYSEYFRATPSPFGSTAERNKAYATIFSYFTLASPPQVLLEHLLNLFEAEAVGALGIFVADSQGLPCLRLVHGLRKYPGPLAQHSPNKNKAFGYLDDNEGEAGELVLVDSAMLSPTIATRVLTLDHHLAELEAHPARLSIPVIPEGTAHSKLIRAHKSFFIPFELVHFLLGKGLSPKQAMEVLHPQLNRAGLMESCIPLFNTLRLAGTTATEPGGSPKLLQPSPFFRSETGLTNYMKLKVMYRDLPELERPWDPPGDPALTAAVTALTDHQLKLSENMDHKRSQSVRTTWGPLYTQRLLLLCGKQEEANLPPIYQAWAQKSKHERTHMIFQSQVAARASELGIQAPLITTAALKRFQDGNFHGTDPFDVADGILPMAFTPPGGSAATLKREQEAAATVAAYDTMISTEGNSLTLKDSLELQKTKAYIPVDWTEATTQLESYLAVLATILGLNHDVITSYQQGLRRLKIQQMPLRRAIADEMGEFLTPAIVVYYFQIRVRGWLEEQWEAASILPSPDFGVDFHTFRMSQNLNWLPNVSNVVALRLLRRPDPPPSPTKAGAKGTARESATQP
eukprot:jgi/Psemu1/60820/gm1.60820_g